MADDRRSGAPCACDGLDRSATGDARSARTCGRGGPAGRPRGAATQQRSGPRSCWRRGLRRRHRPGRCAGRGARRSGRLRGRELAHEARGPGRARSRDARPPWRCAIPVEVPRASGTLTLRTTWVEPAYLEPDASWCVPGGEPASPLRQRRCLRREAALARWPRWPAAWPTEHGPARAGRCGPARTWCGTGPSAPRSRPASPPTARASCASAALRLHARRRLGRLERSSLGRPRARRRARPGRRAPGLGRSAGRGVGRGGRPAAALDAAHRAARPGPPRDRARRRERARRRPRRGQLTGRRDRRRVGGGRRACSTTSSSAPMPRRRPPGPRLGPARASPSTPTGTVLDLTIRSFGIIPARAMPPVDGRSCDDDRRPAGERRPMPCSPPSPRRAGWPTACPGLADPARPLGARRDADPGDPPCRYRPGGSHEPPSVPTPRRAGRPVAGLLGPARPVDHRRRRHPPSSRVGSWPSSRQALANWPTLLAGEGSARPTWSKTTVFLADMADYAAVNEVYVERSSATTGPPVRSSPSPGSAPGGARRGRGLGLRRGAADTGSAGDRSRPAGPGRPGQGVQVVWPKR